MKLIMNKKVLQSAINNLVNGNDVNTSAQYIRDYISKLEQELENDLVAMAHSGANYDTFNPMRKRWEVLRDLLVEKTWTL